MDRYLRQGRFQIPNAIQLNGLERRSIERSVNNINAQRSQPRERRTYTPDLRFKVAKYALLHGVAKASRKFEIPFMTCNTWKKQLDKKQSEEGERIDSLHRSGFGSAARGRPLLLGDHDATVSRTISGLRAAGTPVNRNVAAGVISGVLNANNPSLLASNGGNVDPLVLQRSVLRRMNYSWRRGSGNARRGNEASEETLRVQDAKWKLNVHFLQKRYNVHPRMIANGDETMILYVPSAKYTMNRRGETDIAIIGFDDKNGITVSLTGDSSGAMWPSQLIYKGITNRCLPNTALAPDNWLFSKSRSHWQTDDTCKEWVDDLLIPQFDTIRNEESLEDDAKGLMIWDLHKTHRNSDRLLTFRENNVSPIFVPARRTPKLQVMDVSVNKPFNDRMKHYFTEYYGDQVQRQIRDGVTPENVRINLNLTTIKNTHLTWLVSAWGDVGRSDACLNGFRRVFGNAFRYLN
jgi:hypothetical protein